MDLTALSAEVSCTCCTAHWGEGGIPLHLGVGEKTAADMDLVENETNLCFVLYKTVKWHLIAFSLPPPPSLVLSLFCFFFFNFFEE